MKQIGALLVAAVLALLLAATAGGAGAVLQDDDTNETATTGPGASVSGVVHVQQSQLESRLAVDRFETRLTEAGTPAAKASVVDRTLQRSEARLAVLEQRLADLQAARANGTLSEAAYARQVAPIVAEARALDALADEVEDATDDIDRQALREVGVTPGRVQQLQAGIDDILAADEGDLPTRGLEPEFYRQIAAVAEAYNERVDGIDMGAFGAQVNRERVNLHVQRSDGDTAVVSFRTTGDNRVAELRAGKRPDATIRVTVAESTARAIIGTNESADAASEAFLDGRIRIEGLSTVNNIKWTIANLVLDVIAALVAIVRWLIGVV